MLKIKDGVDLKELEKFGFFKGNACYKCRLDCEFTCEVLNNRCIDIDYDGSENYEYQNWVSNLDVLFDLIQAGLVEKVGGESE